MISVTILVKNGARRFREALDALSLFENIIVYDTGSTDGTLEIAKTYHNVTLYQENFMGFGPCHNAAAAYAKNDWILSIDADEVISKELAEEILNLPFSPDTVYALPFLNFYNGKQIKWCGWYPEKHIRLYNRTRTAFSEAKVHEGVINNGLKEVTLHHPVSHFPYNSISDFLVKMERYSTLFAEQYHLKLRSSPGKAITHALAAFYKSYFLKMGFLGGFEGFLISAYNGHTAFYKYLKLYQLNKKSCF